MALSRLALGAIGGLAGAYAMNAFARLVSRVRGGQEAEGAAPGGDRAGRGVQPPQAEGTSADDAAVRAGAIAYRTVTGRPPRPSTRPRLGSAAHYAFSAIAGCTYVWLADRVPALRAAYGTAYGTVVWALADETVTPALGLSRGPRELPPGVHLFALAGHWVFGATLDATLRIGESCAMPAGRQPDVSGRHRVHELSSTARLNR
jgi:hypothetical protein